MLLDSRWARGDRCPVCGADHAICPGPVTAADVEGRAVGTFTEGDEDMAGAQAIYEVTQPDGKTATFRMTEADAKKRGGRRVADRFAGGQTAGDGTDAKTKIRRPTTEARGAARSAARAKPSAK